MIKITEKCPCCGMVATKISPTEQKVYPLMLEGLTVEEIGAQLFKSPKTVATYKYRMIEKMGLAPQHQSGRRNAVVLLLRHHAHLCLSRWTKGINAERLRNRGSWGKGWIDGYIMAMQHMTKPDIDQIYIADDKEIGIESHLCEAGTG